MDAPGPSLRELFNRTKAKQDDLGNHDPRSGEYKKMLQSMADDLRRCHELVDQRALFSVNEQVEDIATQDIQ